MPRLFVAFGFAFVVVAFATRTTDFEPFLLGGIFVLGALAWVWWERRIATEVRLDDDRVTFVGKHQHVVARRRDIVALEAPVWDFNRVSYITVRFAGSEQPIRVARLRHLVELVLELRRRNPDLRAANLFSTSELLMRQPPEVVADLLEQKRRSRWRRS
jgi:hypothetical protein